MPPDPRITARALTFAQTNAQFGPAIVSTVFGTVPVYRLTPWNVTDIVNKDTGDPGGDMGFYLGRLHSIWSCTPPYIKGSCFLADNPVIISFDVEMDGNYGPYVRCNPEELSQNQNYLDMKTWGCFPWHGRGATPWLDWKLQCMRSKTGGLLWQNQSDCGKGLGSAQGVQYFSHDLLRGLGSSCK